MENRPELNILIGGSTEISKIKGISAAGADPEISFMTPVLDSEIMAEGKCLSMNIPPMTPDGIPTPALISRACMNLTDIDLLIVNGGFHRKPETQFYETGLEVARDPSVGMALPLFHKARESGKKLARNLSGKACVMISESVPGGTTTARAVISNFDNTFKSSSSLPHDPDEIKERFIRKIYERTGRLNRTEDIVREMGDYMQTIASAYIQNSGDQKIVLAGGTQMAVVYHIARLLGGDMKNVELWTTRAIMEHRGDQIKKLVPEDRIHYSNMDFKKSIHEGIRKYGEGNVREGAGMGGHLHLALGEFNHNEIMDEIDRIYGSFLPD